MNSPREYPLRPIFQSRPLHITLLSYASTGLTRLGLWVTYVDTNVALVRGILGLEMKLLKLPYQIEGLKIVLFFISTTFLGMRQGLIAAERLELNAYSQV